jgi:hypothetical protein
MLKVSILNQEHQLLRISEALALLSLAGPVQGSSGTQKSFRIQLTIIFAVGYNGLQQGKKEQ